VTPADSPGEGGIPALLQRRVAALLPLLVVLLYPLVLVNRGALTPHTNGFAAYYTASRILLRDSRELYRVYDDAWFQSQIDAFGFGHVRDIYNVQPPTMSVLMVPVAFLSPTEAKWAWTALSALFWLSGAWLLARLLQRDKEPLLTVMAAASTLYWPLLDDFRQGQVYSFLFLLLAMHLALLLRRRPWVAGVPLGLMLATKLAGGWLCLLLLATRRWRTVLTAGATSLACAAFFSLLFGFEAWAPFLRELPVLVSSPKRYVSAYQTVGGLFGHLFAFDPTWNPHPLFDCQLAAIGCTVVAAGVLLAWTLRFHRAADGALEAQALSLAMYGSLSVSMTPVAANYHYMLVLPTLMIAWWYALEREPFRARSVAALALATLLLEIPQNVYTTGRLQSGWLAIFAYPKVYGAIGLWLWTGRTLEERQRRSCLAPGLWHVDQGVSGGK
jgi:Glycosyltransferase family 87